MAKLPIQKRKTYYDENGIVVGYGAPEAHYVTNPRNYMSLNPIPPSNAKTGKRHIYLRLDRYVQSVIQRQLIEVKK